MLNLSPKMLCAAALLSGASWLLPGCAARTTPVAPQTVTPHPMTPEQQTQLLDSLKTMSPSERAAYMKAHPEAGQALLDQSDRPYTGKP